MRLFKSFFPCLLLLASCSQDSVLPFEGALEIKLSGDIGSLGATASTRGVINGDYDRSLSVYFSRIDQGEDGGWQSYTGVSPLSATRAGGSGQTNIGFTRAQFYQTRQENNGTKLIGWYPEGSYNQSEGTVTFNIGGGTTDVMLTDEVQGDKVNLFGSSGRTFTFNHLLTQVTVKAFGDAAGKDTWGAVQSVKVKGQPTECIVTLPAQTPSWGASTQDLALKNPSDDAVMGDVSLSGTSQSSPGVCGYAMFKPTSGADLTLEVTTEKGGARDITVTLPASASPQYFAAGTAYTVTLEFKSTTIAPTAGITGWITDNSSISGSFPYN